MTSEQPMPAPGRQDVTPVARELFASMLAEREAKGIRTYGTTLQTHNGRDAVQDALEECIDLWQYLVQIRLERGVLLARLDALEAERDELLATSRERGASMSRACTAMARDAVTIRDLTGRLAAAEAALRRGHAALEHGCQPSVHLGWLQGTASRRGHAGGPTGGRGAGRPPHRPAGGGVDASSMRVAGWVRE